MKNGLLLGAGFSYDLGMPLSVELTEVFLNLFTEETAERMTKAMSSRQPYSKDRPIDPKAIKAGWDSLLAYKKSGGKNYEAFLGEVENQAGLGSPTQPERDSYHSLFDYFYRVIHTILDLYQEVSYAVLYAKNKGCFSALKTFLSDEETWVLSLNHDLNFEFLALDFGTPITYGDNHGIEFPLSNLELSKRIQFTYTERKGWSAHHPGFLNGTRGFNLIKLHGGLSEFTYQDGALLCNLQLNKPSSLELAQNFFLYRRMAYYENGEPILMGQDRAISDLSGKFDIISKSMLTGARKYSGTSKVKEGEEKLQILDGVLNVLDELTIIGYGFADEHINFRLSNAMLLNPKLRIMIVDPYRTNIPVSLRQFDYDGRIRSASASAAQWMEYRETGVWNQVQTKTLKENEHLRTEIRKFVEAQLKASLNVRAEI
jgi:hypothetical protein